MKQIKIFVEDVAQGLGIDYAVNQWLESMSDSVEVESIQLSIGASHTPPSATAEAPQNWPVAVLIVYRSK